MESSYLMAIVIRGAIVAKRGIVELAKLLTVVISITIPMYAVVMPYCYFMAENMMPANTPDRLLATMVGIMLGAALMFGIPAAAFWLYGRKLCSRLWR